MKLHVDDRLRVQEVEAPPKMLSTLGKDAKAQGTSVQYQESGDKMWE